MARTLPQDMTYNQLVHQLYSGQPHTFAEFEAAKELYRRGYTRVLERAQATAKRRTTRAAAGWPFRNAHLIERGLA